MGAALLDSFFWLVAVVFYPDAYFAILLYFLFLEARGRQTLAQHMLRLAVLDLQGRPLSYRATLLRLARYLLFPLLFWKGVDWFERTSGSRLWVVPE